MNKELLKDFRDEYTEKLEINDKNEASLKVLMQRKEILENMPVIQDYIKLVKQIEDLKNEVSTNKELFLRTLFDYEGKGLVDETNSIFVYDGSFITRDGNIIRTERNSSDAEFDRYIDIESIEEVDIPVEDRKLFERFNKVIFLDESLPVKQSLYEIHNQFMQDAITNGEKAACKRVLSRNKKNL